MKYIITGGAMSVPIDDVRQIVNTSSGKLAKKFIELIDDENSEIVFIHTDNIQYVNEDIKQITINSPLELLEALKTQITDRCVVIHAMAVSDFKYQGSISVDNLIDVLISDKQNITSIQQARDIIDKSLTKQQKLPSKDDTVLFLRKDIKVVDEIKRINKGCFLVSFKLLSNTTKEQLLLISQKQKERTDSDIVVGNLMNDIDESKHRAVILSKENILRVNTKSDIVMTVLNIVKESYE